MRQRENGMEIQCTATATIDRVPDNERKNALQFEFNFDSIETERIYALAGFDSIMSCFFFHLRLYVDVHNSTGR